MKITIDVTQEDIDRGRRKAHNACAIAVAIFRCTEGVYHASVSGDHTVLYEDELRGPFVEVGALPRKAADFIPLFDSGGQVSPFSFELDIPIEAET